MIREATTGEAATLAEIQWDASLAALAHVFPPELYSYPFDEVTRQLPLAAPILERLFIKYDLRAKTWAQLTKQEPRPTGTAVGPDQPAGDSIPTTHGFSFRFWERRLTKARTCCGEGAGMSFVLTDGEI